MTNKMPPILFQKIINADSCDNVDIAVTAFDNGDRGPTKYRGWLSLSVTLESDTGANIRLNFDISDEAALDLANTILLAHSKVVPQS